MATLEPGTCSGPLAMVRTLAVVDSLLVCLNFYNDFGEKGEFENPL
jgi:hypothetical protein